jgi:hypothetical protein
MAFRSLRLTDIVEQGRRTKPDAFGVAHPMQWLEIFKQAQGKFTDAQRVPRLEAMCHAQVDDIVDDTAATHNALSTFVRGKCWCPSLLSNKEAKIFSLRGMFSVLPETSL